MKIVVVEQTVREYRRAIPYMVYKAYVRYQLWCECDIIIVIVKFNYESWYRTGFIRQNMIINRADLYFILAALPVGYIVGGFLK